MTETKLRDDFEMALFAAWLNVSPEVVPEKYRAHTCEDTARAWGRVAAAARAYLEGWQDISTAPRKDGTAVDLWGINNLSFNKRKERIVNVSWGSVRDWMGTEREDWQHGRGEDFEPSHWRPLPAPPEAAE